MKQRILHTTILGLFFMSCYAQTNWTLKLDSFMTSLAEHQKAMGSLAISQRGNLLYSKAVGFNELSGNTNNPSNTETRYRIGSVTKLFTATMIFQLIDDNKLSMETKLSTYFPQIPNAKKITIAHLLNHKSGIHDFTHDVRYEQWMVDPMSPDTMLKILSEYNADFAPGTEQAYSNSNYWLLSRLIEKIYKKSYEEVLSEKINAVAGLKHTHYGGTINPANNEALSYGYKKNAWTKETETHMSLPHGAGGLVSTPSDLNLFTRALFTGKLTSQKNLEIMKTMQGHYGCGLIEFNFAGKTWLGHDGVIDGFEAIVLYSPDDSVTISFCANGLKYPLNDIIRGAFAIYFETPEPLPSFQPLTMRPADLEKYIGTYACEKLKMRATVVRIDSNLSVEAEGQHPFTPYAAAYDQFRYDQAGVVLQFYPEKNEFKLNQNGKVYLFTKTESTVPKTMVLEGLLIDSVSQEPIAFANIGVPGKRIGTVSDENGKFRLKITQDPTIHSVMISMIGYEARNVALVSFNQNEPKRINIRPQAQQLEEVTVKAKKWKKEKLGNNPLISGILKGQFPGEYGAEVGIPVAIEHGPAMMDEFNFFVMQGEEDSLKFRLNIYTVSSDGLPQKNLLSRNVYFETHNKQGWVSVDLSPYNLQVNENIFVTVQYVKGYPGYKYFSAGYKGTKAWTRDASESYWEETPVSAAMNVVVKR